MNTTPDDTGANLKQLAPLLDQALTQLANGDRAALLLRFFEQRDFRAIGAALGSSEDAARMRVTRALEKLHLILKRQSVTLSVATLGTALASEAATTAPAGLALSVSTAALANAASASSISFTLFKVLTMTKLKTGAIGAIIVAGAVTSIVLQQQARGTSAELDRSLQQQADQIRQFEADNQRLSNVLAQAQTASANTAELAQLRAEAAALRRQTNELATLHSEHRLASQPPTPKTPLQIQEQFTAKMMFEKHWLLAFLLYSQDHHDQLPTDFEQAENFLSREFIPDDSMTRDQFDIIPQGSLTNAEAIVLREKQSWQNSRGNLVRVYGMADGHVEAVTVPCTRTSPDGKVTHYDTFEEFEKGHFVPQPQQQ